MQRTPEWGKHLGQSLAENIEARLVIENVEGGDNLQDIMDRCACRDPAGRPEAAEVLRVLQAMDVPVPVEKVRTRSWNCFALALSALWLAEG